MAATERIGQLAAVLREEGLGAYFATSAISMGYLHGFHEDGHERLMMLAVRNDGAVRLVAPALSAEQAARAGIEDVRPWRDSEDPMVHVRRLAEDWALEKVAVDDEMRAQILLALQEALPGARFVAGQQYLSRLMRRKSEAELDLMRKAGWIADTAFDRVLGFVKPGQTEREVMEFLNRSMRELGGEPDFAIVAAGPNGAEPHHLSDDTVLTDGDVIVLDFGCDVGGYKSDITRTICLGRASDLARRTYEATYAAHMAGRAAAKPGVECQEVDRAARRVIEEAGFGQYFVHRTGHGLGMRGHEEPYMVEGNAERIEEGNCFSVEPGIYIPGQHGVRIENIVAAVAGGLITLNAEPRSEIIEIA